MACKITVVTSVLNGASTLRRCLESVAYQTYPCEHIIVDGGSVDGSQDIVQSFGFGNVKLIDAPGVGISEAFNIGIKQSSGNVIGILNADDWYEQNAIALSMAALVENPDADFTYGSVLIHAGERKILVRPVPREKLLSAAQRYMPFCHISSFVRRNVYLLHGGYNPRFRVAMDFDFYARIISRGAIGQLVESVVGHIRSGGVSSNNHLRRSEYMEISARHIGQWQASLAVYTYALRSSFFGLTIRFPVLQTMLKQAGIQTRFIEWE